MKILLAYDDTPRMNSGETSMVHQLEREYLLMGHQVKILGMSDCNHSYRNGNRYYIASFAIPLYPNGRQTFIRRDRYIQELIDWNPDIIHVHTEFSAAEICRRIARKTGAPFMMTQHTDYGKLYFRDTYETLPVRTITKIWGKIVYRHSAIITVPSQKAKTVASRNHVHCPLVIAGNGIDLSLFQKPFPEEERQKMLKQYGIRHPEKLLVIVSRLSHEKRIQDIFAMMPRLLQRDPEISLLVTGGGPYSNALKKQVQKLKLADHVIFTGAVPREETYRFYKLGRIFLSASDFEMSALSNREAMACGLPLICLDDPALKEILDNGVNGLTYRTEEEFVERVTHLLNDDAFYQKMAAAALEKSKQFSMAACARNFIRIYQKIVTKYQAYTAQGEQMQ